jgi:hypothetical protein
MDDKIHQPYRPLRFLPNESLSTAKEFGVLRFPGRDRNHLFRET